VSSLKPYLDKLRQLLNSLEKDARLTTEEKQHLLNQFEGFIAVSALRRRQLLPPPPGRRQLNGHDFEFIEIVTGKRNED
jgi:hypothetical protein